MGPVMSDITDEVQPTRPVATYRSPPNRAIDQGYEFCQESGDVPIPLVAMRVSCGLQQSPRRGAGDAATTGAMITADTRRMRQRTRNARTGFMAPPLFARNAGHPGRNDG